MVRDVESREGIRLAVVLAALLLPGCSCTPRVVADGGASDAAQKICLPGAPTCLGDRAGICNAFGTGLAGTPTDCGDSGLVCSAGECFVCVPNAVFCDGLTVRSCNPEGTASTEGETCDGLAGETCDASSGVAGCFDACSLAADQRSNVGCIYYAVDLDNARVTDGSGNILDASAQEYAVVVSNPSLLTADVTVEVNNAAPGAPPALSVVDNATVPPGGLHTFALGNRPVDGGGDTLNGMSGSTLTSNAFRITSTAPIVAYQFNPLDNTGTVFSNDASLLIPVTALGHDYIVIGWPQTIAVTPNLNTNFGSHLRATLTIVGTADATTVSIALPPGVGIPAVPGNDVVIAPGGTYTASLGPFDVLNLETDDFAADFTGTFINASAPVGVFSGSEAADVPRWTSLTPPTCPLGGSPDPVNNACCADGSMATPIGTCADGSAAFPAYSGDRRCCADHLEQMLPPLTAVGSRYVAARTPLRGGPLAEPDYWRVMAVTEDTTVTTNLPPPDSVFTLFTGSYRDIVAAGDFVLEASKPVMVAQLIAGQERAAIPFTDPGGDPAFILPAPVDQWRDAYVFLAPDAYIFDFMILSIPEGVDVSFDGGPLPAGCASNPGVGTLAGISYDVVRCPITDGAHSLSADLPIGVVVYGFDSYVSYGYPGGTDLRIVNIL